MKTFNFFTLLLSAILCSGIAAQAQVPEAERQALIDLYQAADGDQWRRNDGWLIADDVCEWYGIACEVTLDTVTGVHLHDNGLAGFLPDSVGNLTGLRTLQLSNNRLAGAIPSSLANLRNLRWLLLQHNQFEGALPAWLINDLKSPHAPMEELQINLAGNSMSGELPEFVAQDGTGHATRLNLADNDFSGPLSPSWHRMALRHLDLSGNRFDAFVPPEWSGFDSLRELVLSDLGWSGPIPEGLAGMGQLTLLDLSHNRLNGPLPDWLADMNLLRFRLQNNQLYGSIEAAVAALDTGPNACCSQELRLADNDFSGAIPDSLRSIIYFVPVNQQPPDAAQSFLPGLDLCWNDLEQPDEGALRDYLREFHEGADIEACLRRDRDEFDASISGSWYQPARSGEGMVQHLLADGRLMLYSFTYSPQLDGRQFWGYGTVPAEGSFALLEPVHAPRVGFDSAGRIRIDRLADGRHHAVYTQLFSTHGGVGIPPQSYRYSARFDQVQLTRVAGSTCDNQQPHQWISGLWREPGTGEGFIVEVIEDGSGVVYWFTFEPGPAGRQAWMMGNGDFDGTVLHIDNLVQPVGGVPGLDFESALVDRQRWGELTLEFFDDWNGDAQWNSNFEEYGSGGQPIRRLTRLKLAECE